ncbi:Aconitate hydratase [Clavibacter michiganensis subsp. michiganensis]|nr:Aconitate hydratase [Clavibacter michiganensis subsp. michiganensis]
MNYLASPPLVIAYALAGSMNFDFDSDALGTDTEGNDVFLKDIWPDADEVQSTIDSSIDTGMFTHQYAGVFDGDERWRSLPTPTGATFEWDAESTYVRKPPYFEGLTMEITPVSDIAGPASSRSWATRSRPTTSARPARSRRTAPRAATSTSTASAERTTTPTDRAAATTRS